MKNTLLILLALGWLSINSIAMAQSPATMTKGNDTLCNDTRLSVEIISVSGFNLDHPTHPATGVSCPFFDGFTTSQAYSWYLWESSYFDPKNSETVVADIDSCGYIKVTVGDQNGNIGHDSIWFNVLNANVPPMENFIMEIDDDLHANFHGIAMEEHHELHLSRSFIPGVFMYNKSFILSPGSWYFRDTTTSYTIDSLWIYKIKLYDPCVSCFEFIIPGSLLGTEDRCLTIKTLLQPMNAQSLYGGMHFVYFIYTVDENGNRHQFVDGDGNPVVLGHRITSWQIPGPHVDPYYQCGVARQYDDGTYELLSLSNKVPNPWPDTDNIDENDEASFSIFPNPSHGQVTVVGKGTLSVVNMLGQIVLRQEIDGESTVELPRGIYFVKLGGAVRKVVVE